MQKKTASKIIVPEKKELYFWEGTQTKENTASKIKVPEKKELYFWERPQRAKKTASKIIVPEKKELYFWDGPQTWKNTTSKIIVPEKGTMFLGWPPNPKERNYIFGSVLKVQKSSFKNYSSKKGKNIVGRLRNMRKRSPKDCSSKQRNFFWSGRGRKPAKARL